MRPIGGRLAPPAAKSEGCRCAARRREIGFAVAPVAIRSEFAQDSEAIAEIA
jgi:hypothetical protein